MHQNHNIQSIKRYGSFSICHFWICLSLATGGGLLMACSAENEPILLESLSAPVNVAQCDVVVAGGSAAALSAALTAAREGANTCLLEPTDWPGGQFTANGVPAVDFAWHSVPGQNLAEAARDPKNIPSELYDWLHKIGNPGQCWVSNHCFEPKHLLNDFIRPALASTPLLRVFYNTVVKKVNLQKSGFQKWIASLTAVHRIPEKNVEWNGYDLRLSQDLPRWYSVNSDKRYRKEVIRFDGRGGRLIVVDATELGDVLVLSGGAYLQGAELLDGESAPHNETCGQSFTLPLVMRYNAETVPDRLPLTEPDHPERYSLKGFKWNEIWRYRRLKGSGLEPAVGELSCQNWELGNDYAHGYLLKDRASTSSEVDDWQGGVELKVLDAAERQAYGWFRWLRQHMPDGKGEHLSVDRSVFSAGHGLSRFPYLRDTRRSIGVGGFLLTSQDLMNDGSGLTGKRFADRIAIGLYSMDIHAMASCSYPATLQNLPTTYPFYIPLRALTQRDVANLLVAGKTMAQTFLANSATRVHPVEFSAGIGAGAAAAVMVDNRIRDTAELLLHYPEVQAVAAKHTPINWSINDKTYPSANESLDPIQLLLCPPGTEANVKLGYCMDDNQAYARFTKSMMQKCQKWGGGKSCTAFHTFAIAGKKVPLLKWNKAFATALRGDGQCMMGSFPDSKYPDICVETPSNSASGYKEVYGPFTVSQIRACINAGGGSSCLSNRWNYSFYDAIRSKLVQVNSVNAKRFDISGFLLK